MSEYNITDKNRVKRVPSRGSYDEVLVHEILDAGFVGHVGFCVEEQPFVIPMAYGRKGKTVYLHGATTSRLIKQLKQGTPVCMTVTHLDGVVLARSAFHHSMNYRSVVIFGKAFEVIENKNEALEIISEHILRGRWTATRKPNAKELKATTVLRLTIEQASAKVRKGPPVDEKEDYQLPIWAGVLPIEQIYHQPVPDPLMNTELSPGEEILEIYK